MNEVAAEPPVALASPSRFVDPTDQAGLNEPGDAVEARQEQDRIGPGLGTGLELDRGGRFAPGVVAAARRQLVGVVTDIDLSQTPFGATRDRLIMTVDQLTRAAASPLTSILSVS